MFLLAIEFVEKVLKILCHGLVHLQSSLIVTAMFVAPAVVAVYIQLVLCASRLSY